MATTSTSSLSDGSELLAVGDVSGKGLNVSMITGALRNRHAESPAAAGPPCPCLNGQELTLEPGLPLGIYHEAEYTDTETHLPSNQPLTFVSDGVIEAANAKNELFGFDRTQSLSLQPAAEIAQAAQSWGQNDDITVAILQRAS